MFPQERRSDSDFSIGDRVIISRADQREYVGLRGFINHFGGRANLLYCSLWVIVQFDGEDGEPYILQVDSACLQHVEVTHTLWGRVEVGGVHP